VDVVEALVTEALQDAYGHFDAVRDVTVDISVGEPDVDLDEIKERFDKGEKLDIDEAETLIRTRKISL
jgi:uncharacterized coiled-coil DUF342 family protein